MPSPDQKRYWVTPETIIHRRKILEFHDKYFCDEIKDDMRSTRKAVELTRTGMGGFLIPTHSMEPDAIKYATFLMRNFIDKYINSPVAWHQQLIAQIFNKGSGVNIDLTPVVTPHTERIIPAWIRPPRGDGLREYITKTVENIRQGNVAVVPPQAERKLKVGSPDKYHKVLRLLFLYLDREKVDCWVMFAGFYPDVRSPDEVKMADWQHYKINVGPTLTKEEIKEQARKANMNLDEFAFDQLRKLVPEEWR
jgi:hypothetical protein